MKRSFDLGTQAWVEEPDEEPINSLEYLQSVYRDPNQSTSTRLRAAIEAAPYEQPKLSAVGFVRDADTFASRLEKCLQRSDKVRKEPMRLIEDLRGRDPRE